MLLTSCSDKRIISVEINRDKLSIDNKVIDRTDFEERLKITIDSLVNSGLNKSMIDVQVTADKQISTNEMSEIEKAIRRQGVTRDYTWTE
jgi:biopolymer transport protein ExbD